jgi:hypothetical protein
MGSTSATAGGGFVRGYGYVWVRTYHTLGGRWAASGGCVGAEPNDEPLSRCYLYMSGCGLPSLPRGLLRIGGGLFPISEGVLPSDERPPAVSGGS